MGWSGFFVAAALLTVGVKAEAQQAGKTPASVSSIKAPLPVLARSFWKSFRQELSKLGWIEGKNITIEYRFAEQRRERLRELAADLVRLQVDLIAVTATPSAVAAKNATTTIPIVMATSADPVRAGVVASLARPGGNVTGNSSLAPELTSKRLEVLKDAIPKLARVGLLRRSRKPADLQLKEIRPAAEALKLKLEEIETQRDAKGLEGAFQTAKQKQVSAIMTTAGPGFFRRKKADRRACRQIPVAGYLPTEGVCR